MTQLYCSLSRAFLGIGIAAIAVVPLRADDAPLAKLGPNAVPVTSDSNYLRNAPAPDYWAFESFVKPQFTTSACSVAAVTGAVNGIRGLPSLAEETVTTQPQMLDLVGDEEWKTLSAEGGDGVSFAQLATFTTEAVAAAGLEGYRVESYKPKVANDTELTALRGMLAANETSADDALLLYFNQGVVTGDWDGPHVSVIGAYDAEADRALILEVDQEWYIPYWTPVPILLDAMLKPTSSEHGPLEGETGGFVHILK
jgi:hypothetical protein